jgi:hypothetical protein
LVTTTLVQAAAILTVPDALFIVCAPVVPHGVFVAENSGFPFVSILRASATDETQVCILNQSRQVQLISVPTYTLPALLLARNCDVIFDVELRRLISYPFVHSNHVVS